MRNLVILNCVDDAKHFINSKYKDANCLVVSTHPSVNGYLEDNGIQIQCHHLLEYIEYDKITELIIETEKVVNDILLKLDTQFSGAFNTILNINSLRWFYALYRYLGKIEYLGMYKIYEVLKNIMQREVFNQIIVYCSVKIGLFNKDDNILEIAKLLHNNLCVFDNKENVQDYPLCPTNHKKNAIRYFFKKILPKCFVGLRNKKTKILQDFISFFTKKKDILLFLPFHDLEFLTFKFREKTLLVDENGKNFMVRLSNKERAKLEEIKKIINDTKLDTERKDLNGLFLEFLISDFCENLEHNFSVIKGLNLYDRKNRIKLGIWTTSPSWRTKALMVEYLLKQNIYVVGAQHGNLYCEFNMAWIHFDSDFNWCHYFLSYGFSEEDLKQTYPDHKKLCTIMPFGNIRHVKKRLFSKREKIDLLFPMTWSLPIIIEGTNIKNFDLTNIQRQLLIFLNNYRDKRIVIKPFPFSNDKNSAVVWLLNKLKNLEVISDLYLQKVIERYDVKAFLIESPSTPLRDAMVGSKDCEIFILNNTFSRYARFTQKFRIEIEKSVHIFDNVDTLKDALDKYFAGEYEKKNVDYYRRRYYERADTKKNIFRLINKLYAQPL